MWSCQNKVVLSEW